jgi:hypothetical protein
MGCDTLQYMNVLAHSKRLTVTGAMDKQKGSWTLQKDSKEC